AGRRNRAVIPCSLCLPRKTSGPSCSGVSCIRGLLLLNSLHRVALKSPHPNSHSHWSPACSPATPCAPVHLRILVHLSGFEILCCKFICGAELLISLVLLRSTDVGPILGRVRENVVGFAAFLDHGYLARRKVLELLLLRGGLRSDRLKAGGHQHALFVLRAALCGGAADHQCTSARALIIWNETICFIFLVLSTFAVVL